MNSIGKILILTGIVILIVGLIVQFGPKIPYLGKLPGDIRIERESFRFYFPITTSILISVLITLILFVINKMKS